jgi:ribosome-binding factor A
MSEARARRLSERIQEIVAEALEFKVKDPRLGFVTVTDVRVTADLREATVFYTVLGDQQAQADTAAALASARGMLRTEVGQGTGIKFTPTLEFVADAVPETARHIEDLLEAARESDEQIAARSTGADFAGEPDPYRRTGAELTDGPIGGSTAALEG